MNNAPISPIEPTPDSLIAAVYTQPDYRDCFLVDWSEQSLEDFAAGFFLKQPRWLSKVSMNLGDQPSIIAAVGDRSFAADSSVGSWKIHGRSDREIMFGEHMGFMEYRFSMLRRPDGAIEAATSVKYLKRFGHLYFAVVKPFHVGFISVALRNAVRSSSHAHPTLGCST